MNDLTDLELVLLCAVWRAWVELNTIRARDGAPYQYYGTKSSVDEQYFGSVVDDCVFAVSVATGEPPTPWPPTVLQQRWKIPHGQIDALLNSSEPSDALKQAVARLHKSRHETP